MTKSRKNLILIMLTALLTFSIGFFALWHTAKAETEVNQDNYTTYDLMESSGNWTFKPGAKIENSDLAFNTENMTLAFELESLASKYENLLKVQSDKIDNYGALGKKSLLMNDVFTFTFTIYRGNGDATTSTALAKITIEIKYTAAHASTSSPILSKSIWLETLVPRLEEEIFLTGFDNNDYDDSLVNMNGGTVSLIGLYYGENPCLLSIGSLHKGGLFNLDKNEFTGNVCITTPSASAKYFVRFDYDFWVNNKDRTLYKDQERDKRYDHISPDKPADSDARSIMDVLNSLKDSNELENQFNSSEVDNANDLLTNTETKTVTVRYLKDIAYTPFATLFETNVTVPVVNEEVGLVDLCVALNVDNVNAINGNSAAGWLEKDVNGIYNVHYLPGVWLRSFTKGEQYFDSYVNTNLSYADYYQRYIEDGIITQDIYEYQWGQLIKAYPNLSGYLPNQVYGFYGLVMIPDHIDLNSLWMDAFGMSTTKSGMITFAESKYNFSDYDDALAKYYALMDKYDYGWLKSFEATFNAAFLDGKLDAKVYLYTCDGKDRVALIGEGGQQSTDDKGAIVNDAGGLAGKIKNFFTKTNETLTELGTEIGTNKTVLIILLIVAVIVIVLIKLWPIIAKNFRRRK